MSVGRPLDVRSDSPNVSITVSADGRPSVVRRTSSLDAKTDMIMVVPFGRPTDIRYRTALGRPMPDVHWLSAPDEERTTPECRQKVVELGRQPCTTFRDVALNITRTLF